MNRAAYGALSDDQREALRAAGGAALGPPIGEISIRKEAFGVFCSRGEVARTATPSGFPALRAATAPLSEDSSGTQRLGPPREIAGCGRKSKRSLRRPARRSLKQAKDRATPSMGSGMTQGEPDADAPPGRAPENWVSQFAFDRGRLRDDDRERQGLPRGVRQLRGQRETPVEWTVEDGGGRSVAEENFNRPGEFFTYRWSRYRDRLTLTPLRGRSPPEPYPREAVAPPG